MPDRPVPVTMYWSFMKSAIFTIVRNEKTYLPIWLNYYSKFFDNIYVLDHNSDDGSTEDIQAHVVRLANDVCFDHVWLKDTVQNFYNELIKRYDVVAFAEADEIIWHPLGLTKILDKPYPLRCRGYDLLQMPDEQPINLEWPILYQRQYWHSNGMYDKTLISRQRMEWSLGFHTSNPSGFYEPELYLIHLKKMDYQTTLQRNQERIKWNWSKTDLEQNLGWQSRVLGEQFNNFYYQPNIELIPQSVITSYAF